MEEKKYGQISVDTGEGKVWIRWSEDSEEQKAEVLTNDPGIIECITGLAASNPDIIDVLTEDGEENLHCVVGPEFKFCLVPAHGNIEIWIEKLHERVDEEE